MTSGMPGSAAGRPRSPPAGWRGLMNSPTRTTKDFGFTDMWLDVGETAYRNWKAFLNSEGEGRPVCTSLDKTVCQKLWNGGSQVSSIH